MVGRRLKLLGAGFDAVVPLGNKIDIGFADALRVLRRRPGTKSVMLYMEGGGEGDDFFEALADTAAQLPVVALIGGRSEAGARDPVAHGLDAIPARPSGWHGRGLWRLRRRFDTRGVCGSDSRAKEPKTSHRWHQLRARACGQRWRRRWHPSFRRALGGRLCIAYAELCAGSRVRAGDRFTADEST